MKCFKCDRCGECFGQDDTDNLIMIGKESIESSDIDIGKDYHLCPNCIESFNEWFDSPDYYDDDIYDI